MKLILYMAITLNGYIAKENNKTPWSEDEWKQFSKFVKEKNNIIIGRKTYEIMKRSSEFKKIGNPFTIVVTSKPEKENHNINFVKSPKEALKLLKNKGFKEVVLAGGSHLNTSFIKENLIDEIYLDVEPLVFGRGIKLFSDGDFETKLNLINIKKISKNLIQLHYKIKK